MTIPNIAPFVFKMAPKSSFEMYVAPQHPTFQNPGANHALSYCALRSRSWGETTLLVTVMTKFKCRCIHDCDPGRRSATVVASLRTTWCDAINGLPYVLPSTCTVPSISVLTARCDLTRNLTCVLAFTCT